MKPDRTVLQCDEKPEPGIGVKTQLVRFALVGCSNFLVSYTVFWLCLRIPFTFQFRASAAQLVSYSVGVVWSFLLNRRFTFDPEGPIARQAGRFVTLQIVLAFSSAAIIGYAVDSLDLPATLTWIVVMSIVTVINFTLCRYWAFA